MRFVAVDWSGKVKRAEEFIWRAEVRDGELVDLRNGLSRDELVAELIRSCGPDTVVGLDFAFSFPAWWCREQGWRSPEDVWRAMRDRGEALLAACEPPFWGRPGRGNPLARERLFRRTETGGAKSVFQIGGAGAVGTGSVRGMPHLLALRAAGFAIWPFEAGMPRVVEIYPRVLTGPVMKSRPEARRRLLDERFAGQELLDVAAESEDAFDAAVSALVMAQHAAQLAALEPTADPLERIEGRIWLPSRP